MLRRLSLGGSTDVGLLLLRLWFGSVLALSHGYGKILDPGRVVRSVEKAGFPLPEVLGPFAALSEFVGGLFLAIGLFTRPAALSVLGTMLGAAFVVHAGDPFSKKEFALAYAVAALAVLVAGPGKYSVDARRKR